MLASFSLNAASENRGFEFLHIVLIAVQKRSYLNVVNFIVFPMKNVLADGRFLLSFSGLIFMFTSNSPNHCFEWTSLSFKC
jgi:hypothetical protein